MAPAPGSKLLEWIEETVGGSVASFVDHNQGFGRHVSMVDVERPGGERVELVLRREAGTVFEGTDVTLAREAAAYRALQDRGVPIPRLYGVTDGQGTLLLERVSGTADTDDLSPAELDALAVHFGEILAALHAIDPDELELPGFPRPRTPADHALLEVVRWRRMLDESTRDPDPLVGFAQRWLERNAPSEVQRTVFVQGDTGPGNLLHRDGRVQALIDWEFCHVGDPLDDLAWIAFRATLQPFGDLAACYRRYCECSGIRFERERVLYYLVLVLFRCAIGPVVGIERGLRTGNVHQGLGANYVGLEAMRGLLCEMLAEVNGWPLELPELPEPGSSRTAELLDSLLGDVTHFVLPALSEVTALARTQSLAASLMHLQAVERYGRALEEEELKELGALLGRRPADGEEATRELDALVRSSGPERDAEIFRHLARRAARSRALWPLPAGPAPWKLPAVPEL